VLIFSHCVSVLSSCFIPDSLARGFRRLLLHAAHLPEYASEKSVTWSAIRSMFSGVIFMSAKAVRERAREP